MSVLKTFNIRDGRQRKQTVEVLYEDDHLVAVNKPAGLRVIPDSFNAALPNLLHMLEARYRKALQAEGQQLWVVHRIDMHTSGVVIFARTPEMHRHLNRMFEHGEVHKTYWAIVRGHVSPKEGRIDFPMEPHPSRSRIMIISEKGKPAVTEYRVLEEFEHFSLVEVYPRTGRTHQIRVHFQAIGNPLAIDPIYAKTLSIDIANLKRDVVRKRRAGDEPPPALMQRLTLHALRLSFQHPITGQPFEVEAALPKDFRALLSALRKWDRRKPQNPQPTPNPPTEEEPLS